MSGRESISVSTRWAAPEARVNEFSTKIKLVYEAFIIPQYS